jgi:hypothetical protein
MSSNHVINWRIKTKERILLAFGGKCCVCGYNKCNRSLHLHHLDPNEKEFSLGGARAWPSAWDKVVKELRKCVMVCSNCHGEIHGGVAKIPSNAQRFDERFADYKEVERNERLKEIEEACPECGKLFYSSRGKYCSQSCCKLHSRKVIRPTKEELEKMLEFKSINQISKDYGLSWNGIKKWCKSYRI